jgi:hypothetical protein
MQAVNASHLQPLRIGDGEIVHSHPAAPRHSGMRAQHAGPESITTIVSMDSGLAPDGTPRNDGEN